MAPSARFDAVLIAASQGGLRACRQVVAPLPADFPAPVVYVQHRVPGAGDAVVWLLRRWCALDVREGADGVELAPGTLTVPPPGVHVALTDGPRLALASGHPGVELADELFTSAASALGPKALIVVLTGRLRDGTAGVRAVKAAGGRVIAQDPESAEQPSMPWNAIATDCVDHVLSPPRIADALVSLVSGPDAPEPFTARDSPFGN